MTEAELTQAIKNGEVKKSTGEQGQPPSIPPLDPMAAFIPILEMLRKPRSYVATAPTSTPKSFLEQIQFYDDGVNRRLYLYLNGTWRYTTLT